MPDFAFDTTAAQVDGKHAWLPIRVPSHGHTAFYGPRLPEGKVLIRKMTVHEESILHSQGLDPVERINTISQNCFRLPAGLSPLELLSTDRVAILLYQRCYSYGRKYTFEARCRCKAATPVTVDFFRDLSYRSPDDVEADMYAKNVTDFAHADPFSVQLEDNPTSVMVRFMRGADENEIVRRTKAVQGQRGNDVSDPSYVYALVRQIVKVETVPDWEALPVGRKEIWVRQLTGADRTRISMAIDERETGINTQVSAVCRNCGSQMTLALPFDIEFFQPTTL